MKKCLIILLILLCSFAVFAADATLDVTLTVGAKGPYFGFRDEQLDSYSDSPNSLTSDQSFDTNDFKGLDGHDNVYAVVTTNSAATASYSLSWSDFSAADANTTIPLTVSVTECMINGTKIEAFTPTEPIKSKGAKGNSDTATISSLEEPSSNVKGARAINFKLDMSIDSADYNAAAASEKYETTLTFGVTAP